MSTVGRDGCAAHWTRGTEARRRYRGNGRMVGATQTSRADALVTLAETALVHDPENLSSAERYQDVVYITARTLAGDAAGRCELDSGQTLAPDTVRHLACDGSLLNLTEDDVGNPNTGKPVDASAWIIPVGTLDYGIAIVSLILRHSWVSCNARPAGSS